MNQKQKEILRILQSDFPLAENPYEILSRRLGIPLKDLLALIRKLKKDRVIRRIGAVASAGKLGYKSTLFAADVSARDLSGIVKFINSFDNITHNYLRDAEYNLWFTFSARSKKQIKDFVEDLKTRKGVKSVMTLPAVKTFKIKAEFKL